MNNQKFVVGVVVCAIVFGGGGYYFGTKKASTATTSFAGANSAFAGRQAGAGGFGGARGARAGGGFSGGEVVSIDAQSITVKGPDGSSKVVFYSPTTPISMMAAGTIADVSAGKNITINGSANPDGSITAESIQLRPEGFGRLGTSTPITR